MKGLPLLTRIPCSPTLIHIGTGLNDALHLHLGVRSIEHSGTYCQVNIYPGFQTSNAFLCISATGGRLIYAHLLNTIGVCYSVTYQRPLPNCPASYLYCSTPLHCRMVALWIQDLVNSIIFLRCAMLFSIPQQLRCVTWYKVVP